MVPALMPAHALHRVNRARFALSAWRMATLTTMRTVPVTSGMPCWFELTTRHADRGAEFLCALAGLTVQRVPMGDFDYLVLSKGEHAVAGVMPMVGSAWPAELPSHWVIYFAVDEVDSVWTHAKELGGSACHEPMDSPIGRMAIVNDPSGAVFTLFRASPGKTDGTNPIGEGAFVWCELGVPDPAAISGFYESLLGWSAIERHDPGFTYRQMRAASGTAVGSIYRHCGERTSPEGPSLEGEGPRSARPAWRPYLQVNSADAAYEQAVRSGAQNDFAPLDIPNMGRFAGVIDPTGAPLTLFEPLPDWTP